jgi:uncharacterized protein DUF1059
LEDIMAKPRTSTRMVADCRRMPSEKNCSLTIAGTEEEVLLVAVRHAVNDHGHKDSPALREQIRGMLTPEGAPEHAEARL